jgi:hypothetical protein
MILAQKRISAQKAAETIQKADLVQTSDNMNTLIELENQIQNIIIKAESS